MHATIEVTAGGWDEERVAEADAEHAVARVAFPTTYGGDLVGGSSVQLLICYTAGTMQDMTTLRGPYSGYELVRGTLAGRTGAFTLEVRGIHDGTVAETQVQVVADSGTGELAGIEGSGSYRATGRTYTLHLDWELA